MVIRKEQNKEMNDKEWNDPNNWTKGSKWLRVYFSHNDTRIWVPKPLPLMGWTVNLAKPAGVAWLIGFLVGIPALTAILMILTH